MTDAADLLPLVAAGDGSAMAACVDRYGGLIWSLARRFLRDAAEAEDAVQDIFVELWRVASRFDATTAGESTFVMTVARRRLIDRRRRIERDVTAHPVDWSCPSREPATKDAFAEVERREEIECVRRSLGALREEERRVLELALIDGYTQSEIAATLGMPLGSVKTHARRGLLRLRELVADVGVSGTLGGSVR